MTMEAICTAIGAVVVLIAVLISALFIGIIVYCGISELIDNIRYKRRARR